MKGIYKIECNKTGKCYVGSSNNLNKRLRQHKWALEGNRHANVKLQRAWDKYGGDCFLFTVMEEVLGSNEDLLKREGQIIKKLDTVSKGYNIQPNPQSNQLGYKHTKESKRKMSEAKKGKMPASAYWTDEEVYQLREQHFAGKTMAQMIRELGVARMTISRMINYQTYRFVSKINEEHKALMEEKLRKHAAGEIEGYNKGNKHTPEFIERFRKAVSKPNLTRRKFTEQQVRDIRRRKAEGETYRALAKEFSVQNGTIVRIVQRTSYKDIK